MFRLLRMILWDVFLMHIQQIILVQVFINLDTGSLVTGRARGPMRPGWDQGETTLGEERSWSQIHMLLKLNCVTGFPNDSKCLELHETDEQQRIHSVLLEQYL